MGGSVGPLDMSGTGTLGGFVELCKEGLPNVPCGLTCEHVVRPHSDDVPPEANFCRSLFSSLHIALLIIPLEIPSNQPIASFRRSPWDTQATEITNAPSLTRIVS